MENRASFMDLFFLIYVSCLSLLCCFVCSLQPCDYLLEMADLLALLCVVVSCAFVTFSFGVQGQVWLGCLTSRIYY